MSASSLLTARQLEVSIGQTRVVRGLDLQLEPGQSLGVLGRNGSGKTTLLRSLAGLHRPDRGELLLDGHPLQTLDRRHIARRLGMLLQHTNYAFEASCEAIALIGRHPHLGPLATESAEDHALARQALADVGLAELAERSCMDLSGGESRRLALATLLVQDPAIMLLDEPTNHLDPANQVAVLDVVIRRQRQSGRAAILALHDVNLATCYCSHVLMLHGDGEWRCGPTAELLNEAELSRLYGCRVRRVDDGQQQVFAVAGAR
ncbi:ABC transporter ATP-binding protein [Wenzhouxiangella marina]|uniref:ABC transporter n=1 Tax=Wenzhouxiangella marina TaxID=1579979 RepID=A0A0K0XZ58_9GAMM|nr:ABC transporter ATP-binding protein [Wenzhouxiangella marina]AKS42906.1 ABC transporter [Wenzhouxiangella marina]MBB6087411.1 iron complex transport system ATP-binding protein [Wenzhouxiangella marina]